MPYGEVLMENSTMNYNSPYKFNGKELDMATGYYYYGARYYDPKRSFWLSVDPLSEITNSPCAYVWNDPVNFADPSGMMGERVGGTDPCDPPGKRTFVRRAWDYLVGLFGSGADKGYKSNARLKVNNNLQIGIPTKISEEQFGPTSWDAGDTYYQQVTSNTLITRKIGANNESPQYRFILPRNFGGWSQDNTGSDGLIWKGCLSCHADNGAFNYATHNSQEANAGKMVSAVILAIVEYKLLGSSSSSSNLKALSSEEMANVWGAGGFKAAPVELFDKAGVEYTEHFAVRISGRASRGVTPEKALDAYRNGRMYYNTETGNYIRYNSTTKISVVVDKLQGGKAITVFEGNPSPTWNIIKYKK